MRKPVAAVLVEMVIAAVGFFVEERFAVPGDILWLGVVVLGTLAIGVLYRPELIRWVRGLSKTSARGKPGWEIAGARKKNFTLKEAAALIAGVDMALPLTGLARDEYEALCRDAENGTLPVLIPRGKAFAPVHGGRPIVQKLALKVQKKFHKDILQKVKVERESLRDYIRSQDRPVPEFLSERFD